MAKHFILPDLGEGIHEAQVVNVMIKEGDAVKEDQMVLEVETDKAAVELPVPYAGVITGLNVKIGDTVKVGQVLLTVDDGSPEAPPPPALPIVEDGSQAATVEEPVAVSEEEAVSAVVAHAPAAAESPVHGPGPVPAAPAVRRLARECGIDLRLVHGTGPGGRIVREDVERYQLTTQAAKATRAPRLTPGTPELARGVAGPAPAAKTAAARPTTPRASPGAPAAGQSDLIGRGGPTLRPEARPPTAADALPDFSQWGTIRREQVPQIRKTIARQMARAWAIIPHVTHADEADVTDLETFRKQQGQVFADQNAKLTLTAFVVKAAAGALIQHPKVNASFDESVGEIIFKDYINIGVAVDTPRGLMVPVVRNVERKNLITISKELKELADRARDFKLDIADMRGGSFTVTNVGALGGTLSTPMINWPEIAILGMGKIITRPVYVGDQLKPRKMLPLFLSFDHRVIDGADGARFMKSVMTFLENPLNLLLVA